MRSALLFFALAFALATSNTATISAAQRQPQRWAMLVGVNDYANLQDLRYAGRDMQGLATALVSAGFPQSHVFLFHDEAKDSRYKPLKANIERQLGLMMRLAEKGDMLLIAFSGHGMHLDGKSYLCPTESQIDNPDGTMIAVDNVYGGLERCPAALRLMLVDACRNDPRPQGRRSATPKDDLTQLGRAFERPPDGIIVLASCAPGQVSYEEEELQQGVFMHYLLKGLDGAADGNGNGKVSLGELYEFAWLQTKTHVARTRSDFQSPQQFGRIDGVFEFQRGLLPILGTWVGTASQKDAAHPEYEVKMHVDSDGGGTIEYPTLKCGGKLTGGFNGGELYTYREKITFGGVNPAGTEGCIDDSLITVRLIDPRTIAWSCSGTWQGEVIIAAATLRKVGQ